MRNAQVNIKYFGMLAEHTSCQCESLDEFSGTVDDLLSVLESRHPGLGEFTFQVAQGHQIARMEDLVTDPEISLLPPFAGG